MNKQPHNTSAVKAQELRESGGDRPGAPVRPNGPYGLCGRKATLNRVQSSGTVTVKVEVAILVPFTGLVLLTLFLRDMLSLALPCILIIFSKAVSFSKFPMHC